MVDSKEDGDIMGVSGETEYGTGKVHGGEVLGTTLGAAGRSKPGGDEELGMGLSGVSFEGTWIGECDPLGI